MDFFNFKKDLIKAVSNSDIPTTLDLLNNKADVNIQNVPGWTPLLVAISKRDNQVAKLLLDFKADPNWQNSPAGTPLTNSLDLKTLPNVPQVHYAGAKDKTVPLELSKKWTKEKDLIIVPKAKHAGPFDLDFN